MENTGPVFLEEGSGTTVRHGEVYNIEEAVGIVENVQPARQEL